MGAWTGDELQRIGAATELQLASERTNGGLRPYVTMWVVGVDGEVYVRSAGGPDRPWYRHARASGRGRIRAGGIERSVTFGEAPQAAHRAIDSAYHSKYDRYGPTIVGHIVGPNAHDVTIRLMPEHAAAGSE